MTIWIWKVNSYYIQNGVIGSSGTRDPLLHCTCFFWVWGGRGNLSSDVKRSLLIVIFNSNN